ncbi:MAG: CHASE domain-containing protein [Sedimenticola sp.]|nr:CHASE domain-containing protein [Sedimenticola sp.]
MNDSVSGQGVQGRIAWLILAAGVALSLVAFFVALKWEERNQLLDFQHQADTIVASFNKELAINLEVLLGLNSLFQASQHVDRKEFGVYARTKLDTHPTIQALEWIPRVPRLARAEHEARAREEGFDDYVIMDSFNTTQKQVAPAREVHFPIYYVEPLSGNERVLGYDLASTQTRLQVLREAADERKLMAFPVIGLVQGGTGLLVIVPLFGGSENPVLKGFTQGVYLVDRIFGQVLGQAFIDPDEFVITVADVTPGFEYQVLFSSHPQGQNTAPWSTTRLAFAGRDLEVRIRPSPQYRQQGSALMPWAILLAGLLLSYLLAQYMRVLRDRESSVRHLVEQRTQALERSRRMTGAIVDSALTALITIDRNGLVRRFNPAAEKMFGYSRNEVVGRNVKMLMPEPYRSAHDGYLKRYQAGGEARIIGIGREVVAQRKDGTEFPVLLSVGEATVNRDPVYVGTLLDITLQKEAERTLVQAKESAETANRQKSEFLNMMSHELRTPLTVILGYLPLLKQADRLPPAESIASIARDIDTSGQHLLNLINDLLDISKIEAGSMSLKCEAVSVKQAVAETITTLTSAARSKGLALLDESGEERVRADPLRLQQILINLVGNAIKFTDRGHVSVKSRHRGDWVTLSVTDTGSGIPQHELKRIFEKFHQLDSSSTRNRGGTGLGLAITERLVKLHGGGIDVTSRPGEGSCFSLTLPLFKGDE